MKVTCLQENLARGLQIAGRAVSTRGSLPILGNVLLRTESGRLKLTATNLEVGINVWVPAKVDDEGSITVPAKLFTDFVNSLPPGPAELSLNVRTKTVHLTFKVDEGPKVRIREVEFPTGWIIAKRVVMSPRYHPWVLVDVPGESRPGVVVLSQTAASYDDVRSELDRLLSTDDPASFFAALPDDQRKAVRAKQLVEGMSPRAVEMSWGLPEKKRIDRPAATEEWTWPGAKRTASFQEERLVRWDEKR